jgi:E3 ubiquitin-protein ligase TRIP12
MEEFELFPQVLILACRCISNLIEALPQITLAIVHQDGVVILIEKIMNIEYIDLAESILSILDKLSGEFPLAILKGNGLLASLQYIDFFSIHNQRMAISIAANAVRGLQSLDRSRGSLYSKQNRKTCKRISGRNYSNFRKAPLFF